MKTETQAVQSINQPVADKAQETTGMLTIFGDEAYFADNSGSYDVIASSPQVKDALRALDRGAYVANLTGQPYPRQSGETGFETFKLEVVGGLEELTGAASRPHGPGSAWSLQVNGRTYELHPKTDNVKLTLDSMGTFGSLQVVGKIDGDHIDVWQVNPRAVHKAPQPPPTQQQAAQQADQSVRVGGQQNKYC